MGGYGNGSCCNDYDDITLLLINSIKTFSFRGFFKKFREENLMQLDFFKIMAVGEKGSLENCEVDWVVDDFRELIFDAL